MNGKSYFKEMQQFVRNCTNDKRLNPLTQLVYRVLCDAANKNYWSDSFVITDSELMNITHIKSKQTLQGIKQRLISLGYIAYSGKPKAYSIKPVPEYKMGSPVDREVDREVDRGSKEGSFPSPQTPQPNFQERDNTVNTAHNTYGKKKQGKRKAEGQHADVGDNKIGALLADVPREYQHLFNKLRRGVNSDI